ncbi:MAG: site-specific integrase [Treponema sp.]|nr:site-specific integrase [Treponema sp.]
MNVVYLFRESNFVRIPFYVYDPKMFTQFIRLGGFWDKPKQEFIFKHGVNIDLLSKSFNIPCVQVNEGFPIQIQVSGFFANTCQKSESSAMKLHNRVAKISELPFSFPHQFSLPEKLSQEWLKKLDDELRSRKYSIQTQKAYIYYNRMICRTMQKTPEELKSDDITTFIAMLEKTKNYSASSMNLAISAIKFLFKNLLNDETISEHHRPHQNGRLPQILSKEEIAKIFGIEKNPKHRLLMMLVYSSGLRVSEVVTLKKEHIDLSRQVIFVNQGKGRKDRMTLLSEKAAQFLEEYYDFFSIEKWLFPGQNPTEHLTIRSAQHIFDKAVRNAGITKKVTIHGLRHTFATHLLESGTDIRYIQTLLGHSSLRTTERYTHVAKRNVLKIKSPLDTI